VEVNHHFMASTSPTSISQLLVSFAAAPKKLFRTQSLALQASSAANLFCFFVKYMHFIEPLGEIRDRWNIFAWAQLSADQFPQTRQF